MAKRGTLEHPKNRRLARALKTYPGNTLGLLESLWSKVSQYHWNGKITRLDLEEIFDVGGFLTVFELQQLIDALSHPEHRWLDPLGQDYYVHDWQDHCEDSVHSRLYRSLETFANGSLPEPKKLGKVEREKLKVQWDRITAAVPPVPAPEAAREVAKTQQTGNSGTPTKPNLAKPCPTTPPRGGERLPSCPRNEPSASRGST